MLQTIKETASFISNKTEFHPEIGIILGTGLGGLVSEIEIEHTIPYNEIPNFPVSTVEGHSGRLILGTLGNKNVVAMQGRFHFYEGYTMEKVTFPVRVIKLLGIKNLIVSNAHILRFSISPSIISCIQQILCHLVCREYIQTRVTHTTFRIKFPFLHVLLLSFRRILLQMN